MTKSSQKKKKEKCYHDVAVSPQRKKLAQKRVGTYRKWVQKDAAITQKYRNSSTDAEMAELRSSNPMPLLPETDDWGIASGRITHQRREIACGANS
jgi:hypothetical protein